MSSEALLRRPDRPASVGGMTEKPTPQDVDAFLDSTVVGDDPALAAAVESSNAAGLPPIAVSVQQGKFLCLLASAIQARRILEIGTLGGCSSIWLARGAGPEGRVVTLEYEPKHAEVARANLQRAGVADRVEVVVGAALDTLPRVGGGPFDHPAGSSRLSHCGRQRHSRWPAATRQTLQVMGEHPRLDTAVIQTVGAKHWDGFALALVG